jgi:peptidyl-prolyl cis-trans isomerase A (cyclophilin A)
MKRFLGLIGVLVITSSAIVLSGCNAEESEEAKVEVAAQSTPSTLLDPTSSAMNQTAPDSFLVKLDTSKGEIIIKVHREWSPRGADRFYNLVANGFYDGCRFFRVIDGFMAQIGIHGDPNVMAVWRNQTIRDDPTIQTNARGTVCFARTGQPHSRSTQFFISYRDNSYLDDSGFSAFGEVIEGMDVADGLYSGYGEGAPRGNGPNQGRLQTEGNAYLERDFPDLDYVKTASVVEDGGTQ